MRTLAVLIAVAAVGVASPSRAASDAECRELWTRADINADGVLSKDEAVRYAALMRIGERRVATEGTITRSEFFDACRADVYAPVRFDADAPLSGASSFTEGQATDRAIGYGAVDHVTAMQKGEDGVWRGTASRGGKTVQVAVDYKGNVFTTVRP
jgi:hypothetical protein